jgi:Protein of unknown function (DUF1059)
MTRKTLDCRATPSASNCTLTISGDEDEVLTAAVHHVTTAHQHADEPGLRAALRSQLTDADVSSPEAFVQLFEFTTGRIEEWDGIQDRFADGIGPARTTRWSILAADRDAAGRYVGIVEFPGYEQAMANSGHPATAQFLSELTKICEAEPTFRNLTVRRARPY